MPATRSAVVPFPPQRAFVVQFRAGARRAGRIEHVASGRSAHFRSLEELLAVVKQLLREVPR